MKVRGLAMLLAAMLCLDAASGRAAIISTFTGGDPGEGLNLAGAFVYAVNVNGNGLGSPAAADQLVGSATFKDDYADSSLIPGVAPFYASPGTPWASSPTYGGTTNDNNLESVMADAAISFDNRLSHELTVVPGTTYQLQAIYNENFYGAGSGPDNQTREQDVRLYDGAYNDNAGTGRTIFDSVSNLNVINLVGAANTLTTGVVVTMNFTALTNTVTLVNNSPAAPTGGLDTLPILNAFTLQVVPEPSSLAMLAFGGVFLGFVKRRRGR